MEKTSEISQPAGYRVKEFCAKAPMSRASFWRRVAEKRIKTIKYGGLVIIPHAEAVRVFEHGC